MPTIAKIIWTTCFVIGTITHCLDLFHGGWLPYDYRPLGWNIYWTSLTFLDPLAAILIWARERWGVWLGMAIMGSNVLVNGYTYLIGYEDFLFGLTLQSLFAAFVFFAAWEHFRSRNREAT